MNEIIGRGAESVIERHNDVVLKKRISKGYRISQIDIPIRRFRTRREAKVMEKLSTSLDVPKIIEVDDKNMMIKMEFIDGQKLVDIFDGSYKEICFEIGKIVAKVHNANVIHGDLTTSNMILHSGKIYLIDFGLSSFSERIEDFAVDLHLLFQAISSKHFRVYEDARRMILDSYYKECLSGKSVLKRLEEVEKRGRNKH